MSSAACAGDDDFDAALFGGPRIFEEQIGSAVGGDDAGFMWNMEFGERLGSKFHGVPVGAGTHDDADERIGDFPLAVGRAPLQRRFRHSRLPLKAWLPFQGRPYRTQRSEQRMPAGKPALQRLKLIPRAIFYEFFQRVATWARCFQ